MKLTILISHDINTFYRIGTNNGMYTPGSLNSKVIMIIGDIWYSFNTRGFKSIHDYTEGINRGFRNASDYYYCLKNGISTYDVFSKLKRYMFLTENDYIEAINMGILKLLIDNTAKETDIIILYPEIITIVNYKSVIVKLNSSFFTRNRSYEGYHFDPSETGYKLANDSYVLKEKGKILTIDEFNLGYLYYFMKIEGFSNLEKYLLFSKVKVGGF